MKIIKEKLDNFPDNIQPIATAVEGQALEDEETFDKRREEAEKEAMKQVKLPVDGAPKQPKPEPVKWPKLKMIESYANGVREYTDQLYDMVEDGIVDAQEILSSLMYWVSEDDIKKFMEVNDLLAFEVDDVEESLTEDTDLDIVVPNEAEEFEDMIQTSDDNNSEKKRLKELDNEFNSLYTTVGPNNIINAIFSKYVTSEEAYEDFLKLIKDFNHINIEEQLNENINAEDTARIVQSVIRNSFGIDTDVQTYKDDEQSNSVIVQFIIPAAENKKLIYDELKEKLYKRFNDNVNISCKTFSSPNLEEKNVEYKIKVFVIKERKDKYGSASKAKSKYFSNAHGSDNEFLNEATPEWDAMDDKSPDEYTLMDLLYNELSSDTQFEHTNRRLPAIRDDLKDPGKKLPLYPNNIRYKSDDSSAATSNDGADVEMSVNYNGDIVIKPKDKTLDFAKVVVDAYSDYEGLTFDTKLDVRTGKEVGIIHIPEKYDGIDQAKKEKRRRLALKKLEQSKNR